MKALALKVRILLLYFGFCSLIPFKMGSIDYLPWKKKAHLIPQKKIHPIPQKEIPRPWWPYTIAKTIRIKFEQFVTLNRTWQFSKH